MAENESGSRFGSQLGGGRRLERVLSRVRGRIDRIDERIAALLAKRRVAVAEVGEIKHLLGLPVEDTRREEEIVSRIRGSGLDEEAKGYVESVYRAIFRCSQAVERKE
jgi:chorismate mutase